MQIALEFFLEVVVPSIFEAVVRLPGYWLLRCRYKASEVDVEGITTMFAGLCVWLLLGVTITLIIWLR